MLLSKLATQLKPARVSGRRRANTRGGAAWAAEVLEERAMLSATFSLSASSLVLGQITQHSNGTELTIRENGANYEFVLALGVWNGTNGGGVSGAGTAVLSVQKSAVAGLSGGIELRAAQGDFNPDPPNPPPWNDVLLQNVDFSTLTGPLSLRLGSLTQAAGTTLKANRLSVRADWLGINLPSVVTSSFAGVTFQQSLVLNNAGSLTLGNLGAGDDLDVAVQGTVTIAAGATFSGFNPQRLTPGTPTVIVNNDGADAVVGTFAEAPEGSKVREWWTPQGIRSVRITYVGGDGNDIALYFSDPPVANANAYRVRKDATVSGNLLGNDSDLDGDPLTVTAVNGSGAAVGSQITLASGAKLTVNSNGTFVYDPNGAFSRLTAGELANENFTYTISDGNGGTSTATVRITVFGAGTSDLIGYSAGQWWVSVSDGSSFTNALWAGWADVAWDALGEGDFNGDARADVYGLLDGAWWVGVSTGSGFTTSRWGGWVSGDWVDVRVADLNGDGRDDVFGRMAGGPWWAALSTGTGFAAAGLWAGWANVDWKDLTLTDLNGDGKADLVARSGGQWWGGLSTGTKFAAPTLWAGWANVDWKNVTLADFDGDNQADLLALYNGQWWAGLSTGSAFGPASVWLRTSFLDLVEVRFGDFDGDGRMDFAGLDDQSAGKYWFIYRSTGTEFHTFTYAVASWADVDWKDVRVGDFNGDGLADIAGRNAGQWTVSLNTGIGRGPFTDEFAGFTTSVWGGWVEVDWRAVAAADATGA